MAWRRQGRLDPAFMMTMSNAYANTKLTDATREEVRDIMGYMYEQVSQALDLGVRCAVLALQGAIVLLALLSSCRLAGSSSATACICCSAESATYGLERGGADAQLGARCRPGAVMLKSSPRRSAS